MMKIRNSTILVTVMTLFAIAPTGPLGRRDALISTAIRDGVVVRACGWGPADCGLPTALALGSQDFASRLAAPRRARRRRRRRRRGGAMRPASPPRDTIAVHVYR